MAPGSPQLEITARNARGATTARTLWTHELVLYFLAFPLLIFSVLYYKVKHAINVVN